MISSETGSGILVDGRLSYGQKGLWFLERLDPEGAYNIAVAARVRGTLDVEALRRALERLVERHDALRTVFPVEGGEPVRRVLDRVEVDFQEAPWSEERLAGEAYRPFSLEHGPLFRVRLLGEVILLSIHHIVADFASLAIMARDLGALYPGESLPPVSASYGDFVRWQEEMLAGRRGERSWEHWREALAGVPDLDLPTDHPRPPVQTWRGWSRALEIPAAEAEAIRSLATGQGATLFTALMAAFQAQLGRYSGQRDFAVGSPTAGRMAPEHAGIIGYFVNPVALRVDLSGDPGFSGLLDRVRRAGLSGLRHAGFPFALVAERLRPERDPARSPLFQAVLSFQRLGPGDPPGIAAFALGESGGRIRLGGLKLESVGLEERRAQFDVALRAAELPSGGIGLSLEVNAALFDAETAGRMLGHLRALLQSAVADPGLPISLLSMLTSEERRQLLVDWNVTPAPAAPELLHRRFEEQAARTPDAEALVVGTERHSYGELNRRANRLARHLRSLGVGPEVRVGVRMKRSADLVVTLLAVLKAGGAYVPLDPSYPEDRLALMAEDSGAEIVISEPWTGEGSDDSDLDPVAVPENLAYLIYTSGSTGRPKAVAIEHRSASVMVAWARGVFGPEELAGVLAATSVSFDVSVFELFVPLSFGGRVILAENALALPGLPAAGEVTLVTAVPSVLAELLRGSSLPPSVRTVSLPGEPVPPALVSTVAAIPGVERIYNFYGPSEDTTYSTIALLAAGREVTVGRPIDGTRAYVLDAAMEPLPIGIPGELYLAGAGLSRGYLGRPELTAERFMPDPFGEPGTRLYRTGDLVRWRPDGELDILGRIDHQVKVRGFRVELGEVEAALARHPGVREAVVVAVEEGVGKRLVAYLVGAVEATELRDFLRRTLPAFMIPSAFVSLEALPLSPNGKVDRKALASGSLSEPVPAAGVAPRTPMEERLAAIWSEILGLERVGVHDDFFDLGGHSLLAARLAFRISEAVGTPLPVGLLFTAPTIASLAKHLEGQSPHAPETAEGAAALPLAPAGHRRWVRDRRILSPLAEAGPVAAGYVAPRTPLEERLAAIWSEGMEVERIGVYDDFFDLGGHSLLAARLSFRISGALGVPVPAGLLLSTAPTIASLAQHLERSLEGQAPPVPERLPEGAEGASHPLSLAQRRLWFLYRLDPADPTYNLSVGVRMKGELRTGALEWSLGEIVRRHEPLRTVYAMEDGEGVQIVQPAVALALARLDLSALPEGEREPALREAVRAETRTPFDLEGGPVARFLLARLQPDEHALIATFHHIASDGWSMEVFFHDLAALYESAAGGRPSPLPELPLRYADYARWQLRTLTAERIEEDLAYWRRQLADLPVLELPTDRPRPAQPSRRGASCPLDLSPDLIAGLQVIGRGRSRQRITLFMTLLAGFAALLSRYTGQSDLPVGLPSAGRDRPETGGMIGFFVNTLVLRARAEGSLPFEELLVQVRDLAVAAQEHQRAPFDRLVEEIPQDRDPSVSPLFQVMLAFLASARRPARMPGLEMRLLDPEVTTAKFDLTLWIHAGHEGGTGAGGFLEYRSDLFEAPAMVRLLGHFQTLLEGAAVDPSLPLSALPLLTPAESRQILVDWNDTGSERPPGLLHQRFEQQAREHPGAEALVVGAERLSYGELNRRANRLARHLRALGVGPEVRVGISLRRTADLVVSLLAVLKAGGAYVPLDPNYPKERLELMRQDSGSLLVIASPVTEETLALYDDSDPDPVALPGNLAYLIYTSGSTGRPKAVAVEHRSAVALVQWAREVFSDGELAGLLASTSIAFDLSVFELFVPLSWGGRVILADNALALPRLPAAREVTLVNTVPSVLAELLNETGSLPASVRTVNLAGEPVPPGLVEAVCNLPEVEKLYNLYGPSEDTTYSTFTLLEAGLPVTIGRPIAGTRAYVLDRDLGLMPMGVPGELYLAGEGLARGYLGRPELTAEKFVPDPFAGSEGEGMRLYKTGDLVRWRPAGDLDFLGRIDHQVKVRGFRIELGEIEEALCQHPGVDKAVVLAPVEKEGGRRLVAYVVPKEEEVPHEVLRDFLGQTLPEFMVPSGFVTLDAMPLSPNGKVDRKALSRIAPTGLHKVFVMPRTPLETTLARLWVEVLGDERTAGIVGVHDNFFDLGGHSLLASRLSTRISSALSVDVPLRALFEAPTVAQLAERLQEMSAQGGQNRPIPRLSRTPGGTARFPVSFSQLREWILDRIEPGTPAYNIPGPMRITGPLSIPVLEGAVLEIIRRHESLRTLFEAGFEAGSEEPLQVVVPGIGFAMPVIDLAGLPEDGREPEMRRLLGRHLETGFDLAAGPLLRMWIARLSPEDHAALFAIHHIVSDGWSMGVFSRELGVLYDAFSQGLPSPLPELPIQYPDFAAWQRQRLQGEFLEEQLGYWRSRLDSSAPLLELPADRPRPPVRTSGGASWRTVWPETLVAPVKALAARSGASFFMVLLAAWQALLARLSGQDDVSVGTFSGNRDRVELEGLIGFFINTLALRTDLSGDPSFRELVDRIKGVTLGAFAHREIPFEKLLEALDVPRDPSRTPLFQTMLVLQNFPREKVALSRVTLEPLAFETGRSNFDLTLWLEEQGEELACDAEYSTDLFEEATVVRMMGYLRNLIETVAADPDASLWSIPLLPAAERAQILDGWSRTIEEPAGAPLLHVLFEAQAARSPEAVAVETGTGERLTYAELNARADRLARYLRSLGVGPESRVGLAVERSPEMLVGMLGVLKAGGAYVPLDPAYPQDRLAYMLEDSGATLLLTQERLADRIPGQVKLVFLDAGELPVADQTEPVEIHPENAAYVIYTSGSTGRPKGVVVSHRSIAAYARTARDYYAVTPADRVLQFGSISFDTSAEEIYPTLIAGATLVLRSDEMALSMSHFLSENARLGITMLALQTAFWHEIVAGLLEGMALPSSMRLVAFGGEEGLLDRLHAWRRHVGPHVRLVNTYGPTEATIVSTYRELAEPDEDPEVPIGKAIPGARTYVLDRRLEPVPAGVKGELMIGGVGVARGYLGRPDLTAERFIPDPYSGVPGARLYRTGDLSRFRMDGDLLFSGRADRQLKLRGYRIEPGEVEAALRQHPALHDAVVDLRGRENDKRLVAWMVPREGQSAPPAADLKAFLRERLPEPMVPSAFLPLATLPLTPSGKVDRRSLPEPEMEKAERPGYAEPESGLERTVAEIFRDLLRVSRVGRNDNFFELGGHSLLVVRAHQRLREALGRDIPVVDLFRFPTVALLARHLGGGEEEKPAFERVQTLAGQQKAAAQAAQLRRKEAMERMRRPGGPKR